ncbi:MAG: spore germination protein [Oscillospiraceae bacterium]
MDRQFYLSLDRNKSEIQSFFGNSVDFYVKEIDILGHPCGIMMCEDLINIEKLWEIALHPLNCLKSDCSAMEVMDFILSQTTIPTLPKPITTFEKAMFLLTSGFTLIFIDGLDSALVVSTQGYPSRGIGEPGAEGSLRGSKESFCDVGRKNMSLVRRRIRSEGLIIETMQVGTATKTEVTIYSHNKYCNKNLVAAVKSRIAKINIPIVTESGFIAPFIDKTKGSLFGSVSYTERADTFCAKLCEGKVGVIVDGCPFAIIYPFLFYEHFSTNDDYVQRPYFVSFIKLLRYLAFIVSIALPGLYVTLANFSPESLPEKLIYFIFSSKNATPLSLFTEAIVIVITLEIIKEAGLRLPKAIGHTVSFVAALIIGDSAVNAGLIGSALLIVCAISTIMSFVVPSFYEAIIILRIIFLVLSGLFGGIGFTFSLLILMLNIVNVKSENQSYLPKLTVKNKSFLLDTFLKSSWRNINKGH